MKRFNLIAFLIFFGLSNNIIAQNPNFIWAKQFGGAGHDESNSVAVDANGNVYTTGLFFGTADFDPGSDTYNLTSAGDGDIFVSKLDASGNLLWAKQFGGPGGQQGLSIAVDANGNVYTTGLFFGTADFEPGSGISNLTSAGGTDIFVSKLDASGSFLWAKQFGGPSDERPNSIAIDVNGNVYTTGNFSGIADFDPGPLIENLISADGIDAFVSKLDPSGSLLWAKQTIHQISTSSVNGTSIVVDVSGYVYTTGYFSGTADFDPGSSVNNLTSLGSNDIYVSKLDASGNFQWAKQMGGGTSDDIGISIIIDVNGNFYTKGLFNGTVDFDPGPGTYNLTTPGVGSQDFITKFDGSGNLLWAKQLGGGFANNGSFIAVDATGNVYSTGSFQFTADFDPGTETYNLTSAGWVDIYVCKLDASGSFLWAKQMGGAAYDYVFSIAVDANNNIYTTGQFESTADFNPESDIYNLTSAGNTDAFVVKLGEQQPPVLPANFLWVKQMGGVSDDGGQAVTVDVNGNVYTTGSFSGTADFDPDAGTYNLTSAGASDMFVSKLNASGNLLWAKQIGGGGLVHASSIAIDASGNVYITGSFESTIDFDPGSLTYNLTSVGGKDIFVCKLDASGNLLWAKQMGGTSTFGDAGLSIAVDTYGNVYTTGLFSFTADFDPGPGIVNLSGGIFIFVSKLDASGYLVWAKQVTGDLPGGDAGLSIAVDTYGNVYTTGYFGGTADFDPGPLTFNLTTAGSNDVFILKLDASGGFLWAKQMVVEGGAGSASGYSIAVDVSGNISTTGVFSGTVDFNPGPAINNLTGPGSFVSKLDASGSFLWAKQFSGTVGSSSIAVDHIGNVYTTGVFSGTADFDPGSSIYNLTSPGNNDIFVSKLNTSGNFQWAKQLGGPNSDESKSIAVDANDNVYIAGNFQGTAEFDPGPGTYNLTSAGGSDIFVVKFNRFPSTYQVPYSTPQNAITPNGRQKIIGDPIQLGTGTYYYKHTDIKIPSINGELNFTRFYNSLNSNVSSSMGYGWSHSYNYSLENKQDTAWDIHYPDGHASTFIPMNNSGQSFPIFSGTTDSVQKNNNNSYSLFTKEKQKYHFDPAGKLDSIVDLNNNITKLYYTGNALDSIVAPGGRSLKLTYSGNKIATVKDPLNRVWNYSYDGNNNLITVQDAKNGTATFTYDSVHHMLTAVNPLGYIIVDNIYDSSSKIISQKDAYNYLTSIVYNFPDTGDATVTNPDNSQIIAHHDNYIRKTSETDELGFTKTYAYDANSNENRFTNENNQIESRLFDIYGNLLFDTLPGGKITQITYNSFNSPVQLTDAKGFQKTFFYNSSSNNLDSIRYPDNSLQVFYYNSKGQVTQSIDGNGNATAYTYSPAGDLLTTQTFARIKQFAYDTAGRKVSSTDENGHTTTYAYDNNDNIILITDPLGRTIENTYDANNQLLSVKDKKGLITSYTYDNKGRKISSTNPKGGVTTYAYNVRDNLISVTDPGNKTVSYTYDAKGRKTSSTNALGTTQYQYDAVGNLTKVIDPTSKTTDYSYTATNKKQSQKDGLGNITNYGYDLNDNLTSLADPLNRVTAYGYDAMNRMINITDAASKTTTVTHDKNGNKKTVVDPNAHTQTYNYDAANRLINYQDAAGNNYAYSYDSAGNNTNLTKPTGTIGKVYDAANRVLTVNNSTGDNYHFTYDNNDNIITMSNNVGTTTMSYDSLNQLKQYQDPYNKIVSFTYDAAGNKTSVIYPGGNTVLYGYDNANNLTSVTDWLSHTFTYSYDAAGRVTQLLYPNGAHCNYGFDNAGRLITKINSLSNNVIFSGNAFTLDATGNRIGEQKLGQATPALSPLSRPYSYGNDDRMLSDSVWNFTNDNSGNRTSETDGTKTASYTFSVDNLLNNWMDTAGINSTYSYNVLGHRIAKAVGSNSNRYVLDISSSLSQILQITDASGVVKSNYVYGLGLLESVDASNNELYYHFDAQHNTSVLTNQSGVINDTYSYDPFGDLLSHTGTSAQPFTFLGEYGVEQESSALYYARARYYDAANGRFISKDAHDYDLNNPQTINRYVYSTNNPVSIFDYTGLYGDQDYSSGYTGLDNYQNYNHDYSGLYVYRSTNGVKGSSFFENEFNSINALPENFGYYSINASLEGFRILGNPVLGSLGKGMTKVGQWGTIIGSIPTFYQNYTGQITSTEAGFSYFVSAYPYLTGKIGLALGGPIGAVVGSFIGSLFTTVGQSIGKEIANWALRDIQ